MKKKQIPLLTILSVLLFLSGCVNKELAFNEKIAKEFLEVKETIDTEHRNILTSRGDENTVRKALHEIKTVLRMNLAYVKELSPSEDAKPFYNEVINYLNLVNKEYTKGLSVLLELDCSDCSEKKDSLINLLQETYSQIGDSEDKTLDVQLEYFKKVGLQPK